MAGSRAYLSGSIFQRASGLVKSGAIKYEERPIWYDVCAAFPPKAQPSMDRILPDQRVADIVYAEDSVRALFNEKFDSSTSVVNMIDKSAPLSLSERFVSKYIELYTPNATEEQMIEASAKAISPTSPLKLKESESDKIAKVFESQKKAWGERWTVIKQKPTSAEVFGDKLVKNESNDADSIN